MAKILQTRLEDGQYKGTITSVSTTIDVGGVKTKVNLFDEAVYKNLPKIDFYTITITLNNGRVITTNKFCNKIIWVDGRGDGWTSCDFFTSGLQRQLGMEDETDDIAIFKSAKDIELYISTYTNPTTQKMTYNVDSTKPKNWDNIIELGLIFK